MKEPQTAAEHLASALRHDKVRILGLALCEHAAPNALAGFDETLMRKFRAATSTMNRAEATLPVSGSDQPAPA